MQCQKHVAEPNYWAALPHLWQSQTCIRCCLTALHQPGKQFASMGDPMRAAAAAAAALAIVTALAGGRESNRLLSVRQTICRAAAGLTEAGNLPTPASAVKDYHCCCCSHEMHHHFFCHRQNTWIPDSGVLSQTCELEDTSRPHPNRQMY